MSLTCATRRNTVWMRSLAFDRDSISQRSPAHCHDGTADATAQRVSELGSRSGDTTLAPPMAQLSRRNILTLRWSDFRPNQPGFAFGPCRFRSESDRTAAFPKIAAVGQGAPS